MQILTAAQIRAWDQFTIAKTPITSIDLMEKAAVVFCQQFQLWFPNKNRSIQIFCGPGNNGGDGLAVARILHFEGYHIQVIICAIRKQTSLDFQENLNRLPAYDTIQILHLQPDTDFSKLPPLDLVIDAIFGSGLNRPIEGYWANLIGWINTNANHIIAIDVPSGLGADDTQYGPTIKAQQTIGFQVPKMAYFFSENSQYVGQWISVEIGLHPKFVQKSISDFTYLTVPLISTILKPRAVFGHKGTFGHALLIAGSYGMMGAAQLAAKAGLRSGLGLLSILSPQSGYTILQISVPEAMVIADPNHKNISQIPNLDKFQTIGIGPGLGQSPETAQALKQLLERAEVPLVIDADALNILAVHSNWLSLLPKFSILTPHPGEFRRLFGKSENSKAELFLLQRKAKELQVIIVLKGAHTRIATPEGKVYFNSTGNPGMATGGSGDVLTGILTGLLAQDYAPVPATLIGVWLHGKAGDLAAIQHHSIAMKAGDIIEHIGKAYQAIDEYSKS